MFRLGKSAFMTETGCSVKLNAATSGIGARSVSAGLRQMPESGRVEFDWIEFR